MRPLDLILDADLLLAKKKRTYRKAPLFKRFLNLVIDYMMIGHCSIFIGIVIGMSLVFFGKVEWVEYLKNEYVSWAMTFGVIFFYYASCEFFLRGKTLGKFVTQTSVRKISGELPTFENILYRSVFRLIPLEPLSIFLGKNEGWHDAFSSTMVVED